MHDYCFSLISTRQSPFANCVDSIMSSNHLLPYSNSILLFCWCVKIICYYLLHVSIYGNKECMSACLSICLYVIFNLRVNSWYVFQIFWYIHLHNVHVGILVRFYFRNDRLVHILNLCGYILEYLLNFINYFSYK